MASGITVVEVARRKTPRVGVSIGIAGLAHAVTPVACIGRRSFAPRAAFVFDVAVVGRDWALELALALGRIALEARLVLVEAICRQRWWGAELPRPFVSRGIYMFLGELYSSAPEL